MKIKINMIVLEDDKLLNEFIKLSRPMNQFSIKEIHYLARFFFHQDHKHFPPHLINEMNKRRVKPKDFLH